VYVIPHHAAHFKLGGGGVTSDPVLGWLHSGEGFIFVGFEVPTAVIMKSIIFWDVTPYNLVQAY
jgi:hypothetical protein